MKKFLFIFAISFSVLLSSCTERRRDTPPEPDGDTVEVVLPDQIN